MKTSKKILIATGIFLIALLIFALFIARRDMKILMADGTVLEYKEVPVKAFKSLDISGSWKVSLKKGKIHKLELAGEKGSNIQPEMKNINSVMYLNNDLYQEHDPLHAQVTVPYLQEIRGRGNTRIEMKNFWSDSLVVILDDSSSFNGIQIDFDKITFKGPGSSEGK